MRRAWSLPLILVVSAATGALVACGSDGVEPKQWAKHVCGTLTPWRKEITTLAEQAQEQLKTAKTPAQAKANVVDLLSGAEQSSEKARKGVDAAGVPAVDHGDQIAKRFVASLLTARNAYGHARSSVDGLQIADAKAFYANVKTTFDTLHDEYAKTELDTDNVGSKDLQKAFDEVPECR
jgi:hypothetical protein